MLQQTAVIHLPEFQVAPSWFEWSVDQVKGLIFVQIVIIALLTALAILKALGIESLMALCMRPFLNLLKIDENASTIMVVGLTLGLGFGGGLMIKEVKAGHVDKMQALSALVFINLFHSVFEDTALMMLLGPSLIVILGATLSILLAGCLSIDCKPSGACLGQLSKWVMRERQMLPRVYQAAVSIGIL